MILLIDNYDSFSYNLYQLLSSLYKEVKVIRNDQISLEDIQTFPLKGIVISPGPGHPENAGVCIEVIQKLGDQIPILGVCLGHQAIGLAFGGLVVRAKEILHGKSSSIFHRRHKLFRGIPLPFQAGRYHSLVVQDLPECLLVEAEDSQGNIMALSHKNFPIFGLQFHPESILTPFGKNILKNFVELYVCPKST